MQDQSITKAENLQIRTRLPLILNSLQAYILFQNWTRCENRRAKCQKLFWLGLIYIIVTHSLISLIKIISTIYTIYRVFGSISYDKMILTWFKLHYRHTLTDFVNQNHIDNLYNIQGVWGHQFWWNQHSIRSELLVMMRMKWLAQSTSKLKSLHRQIFCMIV
jgi:hypothetical protein